MVADLQSVLEALKAHEAELHQLGVRHAAVFGSVARGQARPQSDIDVLVDLDPDQRISVFQYARLKLYIGELLGGASEVVNLRKLKPLLRDNILHEAVNAF
jgi:predicted nucleotidyltransferase